MNPTTWSSSPQNILAHLGRCIIMAGMDYEQLLKLCEGNEIYDLEHLKVLHRELQNTLKALEVLKKKG